MSRRSLQMAAILAMAAASLHEIKDEDHSPRPADPSPEPRRPEPDPEIVAQLREARAARAQRKMQQGHWSRKGSADTVLVLLGLGCVIAIVLAIIYEKGPSPPPSQPQILIDGRAYTTRTLVDQAQGKQWTVIVYDRGPLIVPGTERPWPDKPAEQAVEKP